MQRFSTYSLDSAYNDAPTTIELIEELGNSGVFVSKSHLLVSDDDDDGYDWFDIIPAVGSEPVRCFGFNG